jgi:hypothetical protein
MNLNLTSPAVTRALERITAENEALDRRLAMEEEIRRKREECERQVSAYIARFMAEEAQR